MTVMEDDENWKNVEGEGIASTETDDLEVMPFVLEPVLMQEPLVKRLPPPIPNRVYRGLSKGLKVSSNELVGESY